MVLIIIAAGIVLLIVFLVVREKVAFYTKTNCSICGRQTGYKGNKCFELRDGSMCESCAAKTLTNPESISAQGFAAFGSKTVEDVRLELQRRKQMGDNEWITEKNKERDAALARLTEAKQSNPVPRCPKCGSTSISADKKGFSTGKAVAGAFIAGPVGLAAGGIGANKVQITCLNCGYHWIAGKQ